MFLQAAQRHWVEHEQSDPRAFPAQRARVRPIVALHRAVFRLRGRQNNSRTCCAHVVPSFCSTACTSGKAIGSADNWPEFVECVYTPALREQAASMALSVFRWRGYATRRPFTYVWVDRSQPSFHRRDGSIESTYQMSPRSAKNGERPIFCRARPAVTGPEEKLQYNQSSMWTSSAAAWLSCSGRRVERQA